MAKREILFNDEVYSIEESVIEASLAEMKSRLVDDYSGSGTTIVYDGTTINVDSAKLATAASHLAATLNRFAGSGASIVVNGVTYGIDSAKLSSAKENMSGTLGEMAGVVEEEDELAGTWVFNAKPDLSETFTYNVEFSSRDTEFNILQAFYQSQNNRTYIYYKFSSDTTNTEATVYNTGTKTWGNSDWKTINITSKLSEVENGATLLAWLKANATKQGATSLITFTISGVSYQAKEGMTWGQFINSSYNPTTIPRFEVFQLNGVGYSWDEYNTWPVKNPNLNADVSATDIIESIEYDYYSPVGGGGAN